MVSISNQAMNLFNYLENHNATDQALQQVAAKQKQNTLHDLSLANASIAQGNFDELLNDIESGSANVDLNTMANYFDFNMNKLNSEITQLASSYNVSLPVEIALEEGQLKVLDNSDAGQALQNYLNNDQRLQGLVNQTSKLSEFYEWGSVREQGIKYQNADVNDESLLEYLQEGREQIIHQNSLFIDRSGAVFHSQNQAEQLIEKYNEKFGYTDNNPSGAKSAGSNSGTTNATAGVSATA